MRLKDAIDWGGRRWKRLLLLLGGALLAYWLLLGWLPSIGALHLPSGLEAQLRQRYTVCVSDTPIWPGEPRQPECGQVTLDVVGEGNPPPDLSDAGADRAICFNMTITNPTWTTQGTTRHEIIRHSRLLSKVAIHRNGAWVVEPDEDQMDEARWTLFACPGPFRNGAINP